MQNVDDMIIKTDVIDLINKKTMEKSLQPRRTEVRGECYVSKNSRRKKQINDATKVILTGAALLVVTATLAVSGAMERTDQVRQEINSMHTKFNPVGGKYEQEYNYDEGFVDYVGDLNNLELYNLYNETKDDVDSNNMEEVVEEMEDNYLEGKGRGK